MVTYSHLKELAKTRPPPLSPRIIKYETVTPAGHLMKARTVRRMFCVMCEERFAVCKEAASTKTHRHNRPLFYHRESDAFRCAARLNALFETNTFEVHQLTQSAPITELEKVKRAAAAERLRYRNNKTKTLKERAKGVAQREARNVDHSEFIEVEPKPPKPLSRLEQKQIAEDLAAKAATKRQINNRQTIRREIRKLIEDHTGMPGTQHLLRTIGQVSELFRLPPE